MNSNVIIRASKLRKTFTSRLGNKAEVMKDLSLGIAKGEFAAVMGPSGAGKSTLLYLLGSLDKPDSGKVEVSVGGDFFDYSQMDETQLANFRNKNIGFVFQFHHLLPEFTALENVMIPKMISGSSYDEAKKRAMVLLEQVGTSNRANHKPSELSGGEQQRIALARALINEPPIILADEPTGNLDKANTESVLELMTNLRSDFDVTFIVATHSNEVASIAERTLIINDGKIAQQDD